MSTDALELNLADMARSYRVAGAAFRRIFTPAPRRAALPLSEFLPSPLAIAEQSAGTISIAHRVVEGSTPIIGRRQALLCGARTTLLKLRGPLVVHELRDEECGVWMTDLPEELHQIAFMIRAVRPRGRVLVGGLGLGLVAHFLARLPDVHEIVVVERDPNVIKLVRPHLPGRVRVVRSDIKRDLKAHARPFDFYLLDTWQGTNESTWWSEVMPLKRIIRRRWGAAPVINCWAEDIMAGQVLRQLASSSRGWYYKNLPPAMSAEEAAFFFDRAGTPEWESKYGKLVK